MLRNLIGCKEDCEDCDNHVQDHPVLGYLNEPRENEETLLSQNPIILITGHSLGAAVANLLAADLNTTWTVTANDPWLKIEQTNGTTDTYLDGEGDSTVKIKVEENKEKAFKEEDERYEKAEEGVVPRAGIITIETTSGISGEDKIEEITITQLDKIAEHFAQITNGTMAPRSSSVYNQQLGAWAIYLSCAAYEPKAGVESTPGKDDIYSVLEDFGFDRANIERFNTEENDAAQHTIAYRTIAAPSSTQSTSNSTAAPGYTQISNNMEGELSDDTGMVYLRMDDSGIWGSTSSSVVHNQEFNSKVVGSLDNTRPLIVVAIRGTLTGLNGDLGVDIGTQLGWPPNNNFSTAKDDVLDNLNTYLDVVREGITLRSQNPIILITGHSLGAAVANLLAAHLNEHNLECAVDCEGENCGGYKDSVFGYTFATPRVVKGPKNPYANIFNILNRNDFFPYSPFSYLPLNGVNDIWNRHGNDYHVDMPAGDNYDIPIGDVSSACKPNKKVSGYEIPVFFCLSRHLQPCSSHVGESIEMEHYQPPPGKPYTQHLEAEFCL